MQLRGRAVDFGERRPVTLLRSLYPRLDPALLPQAEELYAGWKAHHDRLRTAGRPARPDDWLAELAVDHVLVQAQRTKDGEAEQRNLGARAGK